MITANDISHHILIAKKNLNRILIPNNSLQYFITNAQIGDSSLFCCGHYTTIFHLLVVRQIIRIQCTIRSSSCHFPYSFYPKMAYLRLSSNIYNFSNKLRRNSSTNVKTGLPLCIADYLSNCLLYCSSHFFYLPAEKEWV